MTYRERLSRAWACPSRPMCTSGNTVAEEERISAELLWEAKNDDRF